MKLLLAARCCLVLLAAGMAHPAWAVDGVTLITQARALAGNVTPGDAGGFPVTISQAGSYRLAGNLTASAAQGCDFNQSCVIHVTSDNVTLDLNGFTVAGAGGASQGVMSQRDNVSVENGTIDGAPFGLSGGVILSGDGSRVHQIRTLSTGIFGTSIFAGDRCTITDNSVQSGLEDSFAIIGGDSCRISDNTSVDHREGITCGANCIVARNVIAKDFGFSAGTNVGIKVGTGSTVVHNSITEADAAAGVESVGILTGTSPVSFGAPSGSLIIGNAVRNNGGLALAVGPDVGYADNVLTNNNGGAEQQVSGGIDLGGNLCGTDTACGAAPRALDE